MRKHIAVRFVIFALILGIRIYMPDYMAYAEDTANDDITIAKTSQFFDAKNNLDEQSEAILVTSTTDQLSEGVEITQSDMPQLEGYDFLVWYVNSVERGRGTSITINDSDINKINGISVVAQYRLPPEIKITIAKTSQFFDAENNMDEQSEQIKFTSIKDQLSEGIEITQNDMPQLEGYDFLVWYVNSVERGRGSSITINNSDITENNTISVVAQYRSPIESEAAIPTQTGTNNVITNGIRYALTTENIDGRLYITLDELGGLKISLREVLELAGYTVGWDPATATVTAYK